MKRSYENELEMIILANTVEATNVQKVCCGSGASSSILGQVNQVQARSLIELIPGLLDQ